MASREIDRAHDPVSQSTVALLRNVARALVIRHNDILMVRKRTPDGGGVRYGLPGGGQRPGESLAQTVVRECLEEIGAAVEVGALLHVAEFDRPAARGGSPRHQVEFVFRCRVADDYLPQNGRRPDKRQAGVEWIGLQQVDRLDVRPDGMAALIRRMAIGQVPVYAGRVVAESAYAPATSDAVVDARDSARWWP